jgi:hypothetical protein
VAARVRRIIVPRLLAAGLLACSLALAGCFPAADATPPPTPVPSPVGPVATGEALEAIARARARIFEALRAAGYRVQDAEVPYRPAEARELVAAPRRVVRAILPDDPQGGFISIYAFQDARHAQEAGRRQAAYLESGPVRIQFPQDVRFVLRQVGQTLVFYSWSPSTANDPEAAGIEEALSGVGTAIPAPG